MRRDQRSKVLEKILNESTSRTRRLIASGYTVKPTYIPIPGITTYRKLAYAITSPKDNKTTIVLADGDSLQTYIESEGYY